MNNAHVIDLPLGMMAGISGGQDNSDTSNNAVTTTAIVSTGVTAGGIASIGIAVGEIAVASSQAIIRGLIET